MKMDIINLGYCDYKIALEKQYEILKKVQEEEINDTLILVEHPPVITMGINADENNVLFSEEMLNREGISLEHTNRGGDATYHGPGQIVGYPIFNLKKNHGRSIKKFVNNLEEVFIKLIKEKYDLEVGRNDCNAGIWLGNEKLVAIGLAVKKGVTMHGFAFNINTNLRHFDYIIPCGLTDKKVTSIENILGEKQDINEIMKDIEVYFKDVYGFEE